MKTILSLALALALPSLSFAATLPTGSPNPPLNSGGQAPGGGGAVQAGQFSDSSLIGCTPFNIDSSTTPVQVVSAATAALHSGGFVSRFDVWGSTTGIGVLMSSNSIAGMGVTASIPAGKAIAGPVQAQMIAFNGGPPAALQSGALVGHFDANLAPAQFGAQGLVVALSTTALQGVGCYRLGDGTATDANHN